MEEARLLEEITILKRIIKSHEVPTEACSQTLGEYACHSVQPGSSSNRLLNIKTNQEPDLKNHKTMIFVNPTKFNSRTIEQKNEKNLPKVLNRYHPLACQTGTNIAKVFFNPNFKLAPTVLGSQTEPKITGSEKTSSCLQNEATSKRLDSAKRNNEQCKQLQNKLYEHQQLRKTDSTTKTGASKKSIMKSSLLINNNKIFVNPKFALPKRDVIKKGTSILHPLKSEMIKLNSLPKTCFVHTQGKQTDHGDKQSLIFGLNSGTSSTIASVRNVVSAKTNSDKKRKIFLNCHNPVEETLVNDKRRKSSEYKVASSNKIFINPGFERKMQNFKEVGNLEHKDHTNLHQENNKSQTYLSKSVPVVNTNKDMISTSISMPQPSTSLIGQGHEKDDKNKSCSQRNRTRSTCLVSVSPTKLIRRRKSSQNIIEASMKTNLNKTIFLSKTKLVRSSPKKSVISGIIPRTRVKRAVQKIHSQFLTPEKINKLRKQSFTNSIANLTNIVPKSTVVTKIKTKNGKSLKLIRKNLEPKNKPSPDCSRFISSNIIHKRKLILKQQAHKNALCIVQNKWKKSQFSKINVPATKKTSQFVVGQNKYVYKRKDLPLSTKARKTTKFFPVTDKKVNYSTTKASERMKVLKSKYSIVRKQAPNSLNKSRRLSRDNKFLAQMNLSSSTSKKKWKLPNNMPTRNFKRKELSIVNIGGVFYRCSRTSLTRNKTASKKVLQISQKGPLLNIRGQRFQLENNGQTLTCLDKKPGRKRIDIGGVTFISSSSGTSLTRTNYHTARSILVQAKQKSISLLTRQLKKNNEPCPFFHRLGLCSGKTRGTCDRQHDSKYVAVCKKFVQGSCTEPHCLLSHSINCHNMPTCQHFLAGHCSRDNCLYPHIKVSDNAPICLDFLKGFCPLGDQCAKRHLELCPSFEKGTCSRGKYCPYPHPKSKSNKKLKGKFKYLKKQPQPPRNSEPVSSSSLRYFEDENLQRENQIQLLEDNELHEEVSSSDRDEERSHSLKNRPRLGRLPSFIPLSLDKSLIENNTQDLNDS